MNKRLFESDQIIEVSAHLRRHSELTNRDPAMEHVYSVARTLVAAIGNDDLKISIHAPSIQNGADGIIITNNGEPCIIPLWLAESICRQCGYKV